LKVLNNSNEEAEADASSCYVPCVEVLAGGLIRLYRQESLDHDVCIRYIGINSDDNYTDWAGISFSPAPDLHQT